MTPATLPFERRFRDWVLGRGMRWETSTLSLPPDGDLTTAHRLTPREPPLRRIFALHGAGNDAFFGWIGLFERQLLRGSEIFTFDLPGHGRASSTRFRPEESGAALSAALDLCQDGDPTLPIHAVGVSLGASLLLGSLPSLQLRLRSAALLVAPLRIVLSGRSFASEIRPRNLALLWTERQRYGLTGLIPSFGPFKRDAYPLRLGEPPPPGLFGYVTALNRALADLRLLEAARQVRIPTLLVYGGRDRVVPPEQGRALADTISAADYFEVEDGTHLSTPLSAAALERLDAWIERWT